VSRELSPHDRGVFVVCAGSDRGVHALASPVAPDRAVRNTPNATPAVTNTGQ
jgi:hypothetical protein